MRPLIGVEPCGHRSPYKRIDPCHPGRKTVITALEIAQIGGRQPDPAIYRYDYFREVWILKEGI